MHFRNARSERGLRLFKQALKTRNIFYKYLIASFIVLEALPSCQISAAAEATHHKVDVCVYGGTASGVMAALAADKEGASVILVEPSRWLGGMTGGGINHLDWGKGNTVGGSTARF